MSGIEVAGLVLGAFPVAIWALEKYRDVARVMGFWYEIRLEHQRSSNELKFHRLSFVRNLKQLLLPIVPDNAQLQNLITNPGGDAWKDPQIQGALETRLQESYGVYLEILGEMQRVMQKLNEELAVDNDAVQSSVERCRSKGSTTSRIKQSFDRSNRSYQAFRIKFSVGEKARSQLFAEFQTYNDRLEKLLASSDVVSELEESRQKKQITTATTTAISRFWSNADKLYRALLEAWRCGCREYHCAHLVLQHRAQTDKDFRLYLDSGTGKGDDRAWSICSLTIKTLDQAPQKMPDLARLSIQGSEASVLVTSAPGQRKTTKSVRFGLDEKSIYIGPSTAVIHTKSTTQSVTIIASEPPTQPALPPTPPLSIYASAEAPDIITDLCYALNDEISASPDPLGYLAPEGSGACFVVHPDSSVADHSHVNLDHFLVEAAQKLTRRQRYRLSLVLASSFVQLKDTAWLQTPWDKRNVHFPAPNGTRNLESPFIMSRFHDHDPKHAWTASTQGGGHDVAGIACLGILLLELCFGRPIEQHPSRPMLPDGVGGAQMRAALDLIAALEWLKDVNDEAGADYTEAVEWCLAGCRTLPGDGSWRKLMVEKVVEPLERCYKYLG